MLLEKLDAFRELFEGARNDRRARRRPGLGIVRGRARARRRTSRWSPPTSRTTQWCRTRSGSSSSTRSSPAWPRAAARRCRSPTGRSTSCSRSPPRTISARTARTLLEIARVLRPGGARAVPARAGLPAVDLSARVPAGDAQATGRARRRAALPGDRALGRRGRARRRSALRADHHLSRRRSRPCTTSRCRSCASLQHVLPCTVDFVFTKR